MSQPTAALEAPATSHGDPRRWLVLPVMCLSLLLIVMDNTIVNVAIPTLQADLGATTSQLQWVVDSYILVFAGLLLTMGSLGDRFGRRGALALGLAIMGAASAASAFATSAGHLITTRAIMGVGAALIMPATLSIITNVFTDRRERAQAIAIWAATAGMAIAIGPVTGGWLLEHFWWGSVFLVNVPVVVVALVLGQLLVPTSRDPAAPRVDLVGAALSIVALVALVWAIIEGPHGWTDPAVLGAFAVAAVVSGVFVVWERRMTQPMLDISFFADPRFSAASGALMLTFFAMMGSLFLLTQFLQSVLGYSALETGVRLLPMAAVQMVLAPLSAKIVERIGSKIVVASGLVIAAGGLLLLSRLAPGATYGQIVVALMVLAAGLALVMPPATESIMGSLPPAKAGVGSAVNDTARQVGAALGVAVLGSIMSSTYRPRVSDAIAGRGVPADVGEAITDQIGAAMSVAERLGGAPGRALADVASTGFADGMGRAFVVGAAALLLGAVMTALFLPARGRDHEMRASDDPVRGALADVAAGAAPAGSVPAGDGADADGARPGATPALSTEMVADQT
jgi:EmrB/QacA subfamily drug resistance transporter